MQRSDIGDTLAYHAVAIHCDTYAPVAGHEASFRNWFDRVTADRFMLRPSSLPGRRRSGRESGSSMRTSYLETMTMNFAIPEPMKVEHEALHAALAGLTRAGGRTAEAAKAVAKVLHAHFVKENEYALPPLSLLVPLSQGKFDSAMAEVLKLTDKLEADMPAMLSEHRDIVAALKALSDAGTAENKSDAVRFASMLAAHAQMEEQVTYPTALLIGRYVKSKVAQGAG